MKNNNLLKYFRNCYYETKRNIFHWKNLFTDTMPKLLFLVYHRVLPEIRFVPPHSAVSLETFNKQIDTLAKKYPVISLTEAVNQCGKGTAENKIQVVLTFDDGYLDNYEIVYPILKHKGLRATFFIITDYVGDNRPFWYPYLVKVLYKNKNINKINIGDDTIFHKIGQLRSSFISSVMEKTKFLSSQARERFLNSLKECVDDRDCDGDKCITWEQAKEMLNNGMEIGSHSSSHSSLSGLSIADAREEIERSKEKIEINLKSPCDHFAFPFGSRADYNQSLLDYVKEAGFKSCSLNIHGYNHLRKNVFCFKRIIMEETTNIACLLG